MVSGLEITAFVINYTFFTIDIIILITIATNRNLRGEHNYFFINFIIASVIQGAFLLPVETKILSSVLWFDHFLPCVFLATLSPFLYIIFFLNMFAWTCDMCYKIMWPFHHQRVVTKERTLIVIIFVWIATFVSCIIAPACGWNDLKKPYSLPGFRCSPLLVTTKSFRYFMLYGIFLPAIVTMVTLNLCIIYKAKQCARKIQDSFVVGNSQPTEDADRKLLSSYKAGRKSTISLIIVILIVVFGLTPMLISIQLVNSGTFISRMSQENAGLMISILHVAMSLTSTAPATYVVRHSEFRSAVIKLLLRKSCHH
ncbi:uncharacterized protein LOC144450550 [Glandiceps talaboti]